MMRFARGIVFAGDSTGSVVRVVDATAARVAGGDQIASVVVGVAPGVQARVARGVGVEVGRGVQVDVEDEAADGVVAHPANDGRIALADMNPSDDFGFS